VSRLEHVGYWVSFRSGGLEPERCLPFGDGATYGSVRIALVGRITPCCDADHKGFVGSPADLSEEVTRWNDLC
jgi:hypothetical protein